MESRIKERDRITREKFKARVNIQISEEDLKNKATYTVDNSNSIRYINLVNDVVRLVHRIKKDEEEKVKNKK